MEGDEDAAILQGLGAQENDLALAGICVAPVSGKNNNMMIPFAVLSALRIHSLMVVDNDSGVAQRMRRTGQPEDECEKALTKQAEDTRALCRLVGATEEDFPTGAVSRTLAFVPDTMETLLASDLPGWDVTRHELIQVGRGVDGKNAATYEIAARECDPGVLVNWKHRPPAAPSCHRRAGPSSVASRPSTGPRRPRYRRRRRQQST